MTPKRVKKCWCCHKNAPESGGWCDECRFAVDVFRKAADALWPAGWWGPPPGLDERIELYAARADAGLPLFTGGRA